MLISAEVRVQAGAGTSASRSNGKTTGSFNDPPTPHYCFHGIFGTIFPIFSFFICVVLFIWVFVGNSAVNMNERVSLSDFATQERVRDTAGI